MAAVGGQPEAPAHSYTVQPMAKRPAYPGQRMIIASQRIPEALVAEIDAEAKARGISRTAVLREVLRLGWAAYRDGAR